MRAKRSPRFQLLLAWATVWGSTAATASTTITVLGPSQYRVVFAFKAPVGTTSVHLAGTFNGWDPRSLALDGADDQGVFRTSMILDQGRYEYKFVLDGKTWVTDPDNPHKTSGYQNAILFLGIDAPGEPGGRVPAPEPVEMAGHVEHPKPVKQLVEALSGPSGDGLSRSLDEWFAAHPMPLFTDASVTFVYAGAQVSDVGVQIAGYGWRTGYDLDRLLEHAPVFAVSLERSKLPPRMAYTFEVTHAGHTETVIDPHAWSLTSRSGNPVALAVEPSDERGRIEVLDNVKPSSGKLRPRDVYVYLPPAYDRRTEQRYPVLYMHDGQNCWDDPTEPFGHGGWCVNLTSDRLINAGQAVPFMVVGVANTPGRMEEYGPGADVLSAEGHAYIRFLERDVKPLVDRRYRTRSGAEHTALMGSSMGGVISLQAALLRPETFGAAACLSPAFEFTAGSAQRYATLVSKVGKVPVRLYVDHGTGGSNQDGAPATRRMVALLRATGWQDGPGFMYFADDGADHNERAWRARLERPLRFLFERP